jgi:3-oxoacyl-[acyl-carrier-protein] synthase II
MKRRVVVTGVGVVSPIGIGKEAFWQSLLSAKCGIGSVTHFDASSYPCKFAAEVADFEPGSYFDPKDARRLSRGSQFAIVSTQQALADGQMKLSQEDPYRAGVVYGTALGPMDIYEKFGATFYERGLKKVNPFFLGMMNYNSMIGAIAYAFDIRGHNTAISAGCSSGNVGDCQRLLRCCGRSSRHRSNRRDGDSDISFDIRSLCRIALHDVTQGWCLKRNVPVWSPAFGFCFGWRRRDIDSGGNGACPKTGAKIYAEILGFGLCNDAADSIVFSPEIRDSEQAFRIALQQSHLQSEETDYICAHAHSSVVLDKKETQVVKNVFRAHAYRIAMSTIKGLVGHSMAAGTAMQSITACLALERGILPPTANYEEPDPECDLDYVPNRARHKKIQVALVNSFGLGGTNIVIAFRKI